MSDLPSPNDMAIAERKTWLVTGAGRGLGAALAREVIAQEDRLYAVVRSRQDAAWIKTLGDDAHALIADVTDEAAITGGVRQIEEQHGAIDVVVNNAGYGLVGAIEEVSLSQLRALFDVNFYAAVNVIQAVLPRMRQRRAGHIINITSVSGLAPWAGTGAYTASKFALEGLGQTLHEELSELSIHVTNVAPGGLRTAFGGPSLQTADKVIEDYAGAAHLPKKVYQETAGQEPNDPALAAQAICQIAALQDPPRHLLLGADALGYYDDAQARIKDDIDRYKELTLSVLHSSCEDTGQE
ncbi:MAG: oxidoreductase [Pseudomonadota bacterium]